jgi:hypothetical protein
MPLPDNWTVAPGMDAAEGSVTCPRNVPVVCALTDSAQNKTKTTNVDSTIE